MENRAKDPRNRHAHKRLSPKRVKRKWYISHIFAHTDTHAKFVTCVITRERQLPFYRMLTVHICICDSAVSPSFYSPGALWLVLTLRDSRVYFYFITFGWHSAARLLARHSQTHSLIHTLYCMWRLYLTDYTVMHMEYEIFSIAQHYSNYIPLG